ncbi:MAG: hypothetical protein Q7K43_04915, partial [Candidatus Woesearchaeota archaeon]|nr:hypothetical protein [Candidatus Woesearchaeota archaeon]
EARVIADKTITEAENNRIFSKNAIATSKNAATEAKAIAEFVDKATAQPAATRTDNSDTTVIRARIDAAQSDVAATSIYISQEMQDYIDANRDANPQLVAEIVTGCSSCSLLLRQVDAMAMLAQNLYRDAEQMTDAIEKTKTIKQAQAQLQRAVDAIAHEMKNTEMQEFAKGEIDATKAIGENTELKTAIEHVNKALNALDARIKNYPELKNLQKLQNVLGTYKTSLELMRDIKKAELKNELEALDIPITDKSVEALSNKVASIEELRRELDARTSLNNKVAYLKSLGVSETIANIIALKVEEQKRLDEQKNPKNNQNQEDARTEQPKKVKSSTYLTLDEILKGESDAAKDLRTKRLSEATIGDQRAPGLLGVLMAAAAKKPVLSRSAAFIGIVCYSVPAEKCEEEKLRAREYLKQLTDANDKIAKSDLDAWQKDAVLAELDSGRLEPIRIDLNYINRIKLALNKDEVWKILKENDAQIKMILEGESLGVVKGNKNVDKTAATEKKAEENTATAKDTTDKKIAATQETTLD